ncbi:hypothetical protein JL722_14483 [Aureococcus anophagefferens]|nr:hypothetical protein JL722_14483 [Aureococcus anophagefferens]
MAYQKKLKLEVRRELIEEEPSKEPTLQEQLLSHCVKINGSWRYQVDVKQTGEAFDKKKKQKRKKKRGGGPDRGAIREELEAAGADDKFLGQALKKKRRKKDAGKSAVDLLVEASEELSYDPDNESAMTEDLRPGESLEDLTKIMDKEGYDSGTLSRPGKLVVLEARLVKKQKKAQEAQEEEETPAEAEAARKKMAQVTHRVPPAVKLDPSLSLQDKQIQMLRLADKVICSYKKLEHFIGIDKVGSPDVGYSMDIDDGTVVKGIRAVLFGQELPRRGLERRVAAHGGGAHGARGGAPRGEDGPGGGHRVDFVNGSNTYKVERVLCYFQMLGFLSTLDLPWTPQLRDQLNTFRVFLDGHLRPLTHAHKLLYENTYFGLDKPLSLVDLYFYRDVTKYFYSIALSLILVVALFYLWGIHDYTDPKFTNRWLDLHIEHWWTRGIPLSILYVAVIGGVLVVGPAGIMKYSYGRSGSDKQANAILVCGGSLAAYLWIAYVALTSCWRKYFRSKVKHSKAYASIVLLKETVKSKVTFVFCALFYCYMPTCLYVVGGVIPIYSIEVWDRAAKRVIQRHFNVWEQHGADSPSEPLPSAYRHVSCYWLSFPPAIRERKMNARGRGGRCRWASRTTSRAHRPHDAIRRVECFDVGGVLMFTNSVLWCLLYLVGFPVMIYYLIGIAPRIAETQLHACEWWSNYMTAWRRFNLVLRECEAWDLGMIFSQTFEVWKEQVVVDAKQARRDAKRAFVRFWKRQGRRLCRLICFPCLCLLRLCRGSEESRRRKRKYLSMAEAGDEPHRKARVLDDQPQNFWAHEESKDEQSTGSTLTSGSAASRTSAAAAGPRATRRGGAYGRTHVVAVDADGEEVKDDGDDGAVTLDPDLDDGKPKMLLEIPDDDFVIPTRGVRGFCYRLQMHPVFENLITLAVLVSLTPIIPSVKADMQDLLGRHPIEGDDDEAETSCFRMNCMYYDYFKDWFNRLDFFLMLLWIMDVGLGSGTNLSFLKSLKALKSLKSMKALKSLKTLKVLRLLKFGKYIDPLFRAFKRWLLRWIADTRLASEVHLQKGQGAQSDWRAKRSLPAKLEMLKKGFQHAKREYAVSFEEFERDHELEITNFEAIVDTAALGYLIAQFKPNASIWRLVLIAETLIFCILVTWLKATQQPWVICVAGALVRFVFGLWTFLKRPYMFTREGQVDSLTRQTTIFLLVLGALLDLTRDPGFGMEMEADQAEKLRYYVDIIGAALLYGTILRMLFLLRAHEMAHDAVVAAIRYCDEQVLTLIIGLIDVKCYAFEDCNLGLQVLRQWDVLIDRQQATKLRAWPSPNPSNLLTLYQKGVLVKWAAARDLRISTFRTPTGQCILHSAMLKGEPEIVAWILYHHPELLTVCDDQRDSPVVIALKELAFTLLKHQKKPTEATAWKRAKLAEILLSDQIQCYRVPWSLPHFRALGDIAVPLLGELVQQLALALNLQPPAGFVRISKWSRYPGDIPDFLAECYIACRDVVDTPRSELGDVQGRKRSYPIYIVRIDARMNRLDGKMGQFAARAIAANKTLTYLDLRYNNIDDDGGVALAKALKKNESLTLVSLAQNRLGPNAGDALGSMMRRNITIRTLNLADNQLGPCLSYSNEYTRDFLPSSGPKICHALRVNGTITALDVSNNRLGADAAQALDQSFGGTRSRRRTLGFAGNELRADGGKHLAHALRSRVQLTHLDASRNRFGAGVGVATATANGGSGPPNTSGGSRPNTGASRPGTGKSGKGDLKAGADHGLGLVDVVQTPGLQAFDVSGCSARPRLHRRARRAAAAHGPARRRQRHRREARERVAEIFTEGCELDTLDVSANGLGETGGLTIARAMELNVTLTDVDMSRNELNEEVGSAVADALIELVESGFVARPAHCVRLCLSHNLIGTTAACDIFTALRNPVARDIDLSFCGIGPAAGEEVARCLRRSTVQWSRLDLEGNDLGKDGVNPIMWALRLNCTLTELLLSNNGIGGDFGTDRDRRATTATRFKAPSSTTSR